MGGEAATVIIVQFIDLLKKKKHSPAVHAVILKAATRKMKARNSNISGEFTSDCLLQGPDVLYSNIAAVFCGWMVQRTVTPSLLACAFLPSLKVPSRKILFP